MGCGVLDKGHLKTKLTHMPYEQCSLCLQGHLPPEDFFSAASNHSRAHCEGLGTRETDSGFH